MGMPVELFGAMARSPLGPAVLAVESGAPTFVVGTRRTGWGSWAIRVERIAPVTAGTLRQRIVAQLGAQARAFERIIGDAPEQWWTCFFPVWSSHPAESPQTERRAIDEAA
jgi:KDO2-lipid IV(A) lauroyltransferase